MPNEQFLGGVEERKFQTLPAQQQNMDVKALTDLVNRINGRLISLERSISDLREVIRFHEDRTNKHNKEQTSKQKTTEEKYHEISDKFDQLQQTVSLVIKELQLTAKKEDVDVLKRVIEIIRPTQFITQKRAEELINTILEEKGLINQKDEE